MGRVAKRKQADPEPLEKPVRRDTGKIRSGGKTKRAKPEKNKATVDKKQKSKNLDEDALLEEQRAAYFDDVDLEEEPEALNDEFDLAADELPASASDSEQQDLEDVEPEEEQPLPRLPAAAFEEDQENDDSELELLQNAPIDDSEDEEDMDLLNQEDSGPPSIHLVKARLASAVKALKNWKALGSATGKSRSDVYDQFIQDVCEYYGYNTYLAEKLVELFPIEEAIAFLDASDTQRPVTIRVNTLKTKRRELAQALVNRGVNLEPIGKWTKVGLQVFESPVPVGATPEYLAGHYILQAASSFLPVIALEPQPNERVLDMSAAPGGKTTYLSALMQNTGVVFANDSSKARTKGLAGNVARLGCKNVVICNYDGREFPKVMGGFDRVLLDAPCSGTGVISKDPSVKTNKSDKDFLLLSQLQKQLVLCAIDSVSPNSKTGSYVVYSTCSVTVEENESVVAYALKKRPHAKLVETGLEFGREGFKSFKGKEYGDEMRKTRRFLPHLYNCDGFFVAKFKVGKPLKKNKLADNGKEDSDESNLAENGRPEEAVAFDDKEDQDIIAEGKRKALKRKGIKPTDGASEKKHKKPKNSKTTKA